MSKKAKNNSNFVYLSDGRLLLTLVKQLGEGKAGIVYLAKVMTPINELHEGANVAVKFYKPDILKQPYQKIRLRREAEISFKVIHPNILRIYCLTDTNYGKCLLMEYIPGGTLRQLLKRGIIRSNINLCIQLLASITAIHKVGLIHRDLKPENILLTKDCSVLKIADFGVVRQLKEITITPSHQFLGTIRYASPEYLFKGKASFQSDQYSIGTIIYEILTNKPLVAETGTFASQIMEVRSRKNIPLIKKVFKKNSHNEIVRNFVLEALLDFDPDNRFKKTSDAYYLFRDTIRSQWWKEWVEAGHEECMTALLEERKSRKMAEKKIKHMIAKGEYSKVLNEAHLENDMDGYSDDPLVGIDTCIVCNNRTFGIYNLDGNGMCNFCGYRRNSLFQRWNKLIKSFSLDDNFFKLVALGTVLEGFHGIPSVETLMKIQKMDPYFSEIKKKQ